MNQHQLNGQIKVKTALIIDSAGKKIGILPVAEGIQMAQRDGLDLVLVSDDPAVCRILDYKKLLYEQKKKEQAQKVANRTKRHSEECKEYKFGRSIGKHDLDVKLKKINESLEDNYRIKISMFLRRAELRHKAEAIEQMKEIYRMIVGSEPDSQTLRVGDNNISAVILPSQRKT